jgi:hypothetical protein
MAKATREKGAARHDKGDACRRGDMAEKGRQQMKKEKKKRKTRTRWLQRRAMQQGKATHEEGQRDAWQRCGESGARRQGEGDT